MYIYLEETKKTTKNETRIKENKEKKFSKLENKRNKNYEDLGYKSSLCKESRFNPFCR